MPAIDYSEPAEGEAMREYQAVIIRCQGRAKEDEETVTDLLNERSRMGWEFVRLESLDGAKLLVVFVRET